MKISITNRVKWQVIVNGVVLSQHNSDTEAGEHALNADWLMTLIHVKTQRELTC